MFHWLDMMCCLIVEWVEFDENAIGLIFKERRSKIMFHWLDMMCCLIVEWVEFQENAP